MLVIQKCYGCGIITNKFEVNKEDETKLEGGCGVTSCLSCALKETNPSLLVLVEGLAKEGNKTTEEFLQEICLEYG